MTQLSFMKAHPNKKAHRNHLLRDYARTHPKLSLTEIGKIFRITKQRAHQILKAG